MIYCRYYNEHVLARCEQEAILILISGCHQQHVDDRPMCRDHYLASEDHTINGQTGCTICQQPIQDWETLHIRQAGTLWKQAEQTIQKLLWQVTSQ